MVNQRVRILKKKQKGADIGFKSYKGETWSKRVYIVRKTQAKTATSPWKYYVNSKWLTKDKLKLSEQADVKTNDMIEKRDKEQDEKDQEEEEKQSEVAAEKEKKRLIEKEKKEKAGIIPTTRRTRFSARLKAQREAGEALDRQLAEKEPRKRRVVVRGTKYEREGEEEWVPGQDKRPKKQRPKRFVKRKGLRPRRVKRV